MTAQLLAFDVPAEAVTTFTAATDDSGATFDGLAVPFGVASLPSAADGHRYRFTTAPDNADQLVDVVREHDRSTVIGRLLSPWRTVANGLAALARVTDRAAVDEAVSGERSGFSVGALIHAFTTAADGVRDVTRWSADHLGVVKTPAFTNARGFLITCSAEQVAPHRKVTAMPENDQPGGATVEQLPTVAELAAQVAEHLAVPTVEQITEQVREALGHRKDAHPLATFASFADYAAAFQQAGVEGDVERQQALVTAFAVADQISANNPGVVQPGWRTDVKANLDARRPAIQAFGGAIGLPDTGMSVSWPYFAGNLDAIIAQQAAEKQELSGPRIDILKGDQPLETAGAVSDIAYQLLMRSSPSYLAAYWQILEAAWGRFTEKKFEDKLVATGTNAGALPALANAAAVRSFLFGASMDVADATGAPASVVLASRDRFLAWGGFDGLHNPKYGPNTNTSGTSDASTLTINVNGLEVTYAPFLAANTVVVSNESAAKFSETGPMQATSEDVRKLGRDAAVWGMYAPGEIYFPNGVRVYKPAA